MSTVRFGDTYVSVNANLSYTMSKKEQEKMVEIWTSVMQKVFASKEISDSLSKVFQAKETLSGLKDGVSSSVAQGVNEGGSSAKKSTNHLMDIRNITTSTDPQAVKNLNAMFKGANVSDSDASSMTENFVAGLNKGTIKSKKELSGVFDEQDDDALKATKVISHLQQMVSGGERSKALDLASNYFGKDFLRRNEKLITNEDYSKEFEDRDFTNEEERGKGFSNLKEKDAPQARISDVDVNDVPLIQEELRREVEQKATPTAETSAPVVPGGLGITELLQALYTCVAAGVEEQKTTNSILLNNSNISILNQNNFLSFEETGPKLYY